MELRSSQRPPPTQDFLTRSSTRTRSLTGYKQNYLLTYNVVSLLLWIAVFGRLTLLVPLVGYANVYGGLGDFTRWTQTLAILEVVNSGLGLVRAPLFTTLLQVLSRLVLVWLITYPSPLPFLNISFAPATTTSLFYSSMLLAWSITEMIRYAFFAVTLSNGSTSTSTSTSNGGGGSEERGGSSTGRSRGRSRGVPPWLTWLRYNTFFALYPLGIGSECALVWKASRLASAFATSTAAAAAASAPGASTSPPPLRLPLLVRWTPYALWAVLAVYVPGSYVLYSHMIRQRRRVLRGKGKEKD